MCNFFQKSESSKYREKRFGYPGPYPVPVRRQFLDIRIRLQTHYPARYATGKPDSDHLCCSQPFQACVLINCIPVSEDVSSCWGWDFEIETRNQY